MDSEHVQDLGDKIVEVLKTISNNSKVEIPLRELPNGTYILVLETNGERKFQKVIIQK